MINSRGRRRRGRERRQRRKIKRAVYNYIPMSVANVGKGFENPDHKHRDRSGKSSSAAVEELSPQRDRLL